MKDYTTGTRVFDYLLKGEIEIWNIESYGPEKNVSGVASGQVY